MSQVKPTPVAPSITFEQLRKLGEDLGIISPQSRPVQPVVIQTDVAQQTVRLMWPCGKPAEVITSTNGERRAQVAIEDKLVKHFKAGQCGCVNAPVHITKWRSSMSRIPQPQSDTSSAA